MIIAQISDTHIDPENPVGVRRLRDLERIVAAVNGLARRPDAIIHTGDMVHNGTPEKYDLALGVLKDLRAPLYAAPGNRDDRALIRARFPAGRDLLPGSPFLQYAVEEHPVRLIALDTLSGASNMGDFCAERADSLRRALAEGEAKPCVLFMHHPPFEVRESKYRWQYDSQDAIGLLAGCVDGRDQVVRVFCGHAHRESHGAVSGVPASTAPSVAIDLRLGDFPGAADAPVFHLHRYQPETGFTTELRVAA